MPFTFEDSIELEDFENPVFSIALTPDARLAVTGRARSAVSVWDSRTGEMIDASYDPRATTAIEVTPDARRIICRGRGSTRVSIHP